MAWFIALSKHFLGGNEKRHGNFRDETPNLPILEIGFLQIKLHLFNSFAFTWKKQKQ